VTTQLQLTNILYHEREIPRTRVLVYRAS